MTDAEENYRPSKVDLLVSLTMMIEQFESHPDNRDTLSLRLSFADDASSEYVWGKGGFEVASPTGKE